MQDALAPNGRCVRFKKPRAQMDFRNRSSSWVVGMRRREKIGNLMRVSVQRRQSWTSARFQNAPRATMALSSKPKLPMISSRSFPIALAGVFLEYLTLILMGKSSRILLRTMRYLRTFVQQASQLEPASRRRLSSKTLCQEAFVTLYHLGHSLVGILSLAPRARFN